MAYAHAHEGIITVLGQVQFYDKLNLPASFLLDFSSLKISI